MTSISSLESASSHAIRDWESALRGMFSDWNHQRMGQKNFVVRNRVEAALDHSLSPYTSEDLKSEIVEALHGSTEMDINQWYGMLQAGDWYGVLQQLWPVPYEEDATRDGTPPFYTDKDWETANEVWETVLRKRFTGWEVDVSGNTAMKMVVWVCLTQRLLWALEHPSLRLLPNQKDTIRKRIETADLNTIGNLLDMLKAGQWLKAVRMLGSISSETSASITDIMEHWTDKFGGRALTAFRDRLIVDEEKFQRAEQKVKDNKDSNAGYYAKTIDIVQSSGMGKSRLVSEMAKRVMTITFVLRLPGETGFPPGDKGLLDFVLAGNPNSLQDAHMRAMCLLGGTFFEVAKWCKSVSASGGTLLEMWNDAMSPLNPPLFPDATDRRSASRVQLYNSILRKAEENLKELVEGTIPGKVGSSGSEPGRKWDWNDTEVDYDQSQEFIQIVENPLLELLKLIPASVEGLPTLLIAFDEAANMYTDGTNSRTGSGSQLAHPSIRRMLRGLRDHRLWSVFMSKNSRIEKFVTSMEDDPSARVVGRLLRQGGKFAAFEIDIESKGRVNQSPDMELNKEICTFATVDHMTMFGRPLWRFYARRRYTDLRAFVYMKMMGGHARFSSANLHHVFTAVASRVCLDPCLNNQRLNFASETVDYHLRLVTGVDQVSGMLKTATPSEPVVADVAATMLVRNDGSNSDMEAWTNSILLLSKHLLGGGYIDNGIKGELFGRLLCILARDQLPDGLSAGEDFRYSRPFKVDMFLNELLGNGTVNGLIDTRLRHRPRGGFAQGTLPVWDEKFDFRQGWCNFNHFTFTTQKLPSDRERFQMAILGLLKRSAALQLAPSQPDWDLLLPVYTGDINKPIDRDHLSAIFVQIKNRQKPAKMTLETEYRHCFLPGQLIFCLQMEFGAGSQTPAAHMRWPTCKRSSDGSPNVSEPFLFGMQVFGADGSTFPFLSKYPTLSKACGNLLRSLTIESEYPYEESLFDSLIGYDMDDLERK